MRVSASPEYGGEQGVAGGEHNSVGFNLLVIPARHGHITEITFIIKFIRLLLRVSRKSAHLKGIMSANAVIVAKHWTGRINVVKHLNQLCF